MRLAVLIPRREVGHFGREERHGSKYKQNQNGQGKEKKKKNPLPNAGGCSHSLTQKDRNCQEGLS